MTEQEVLSVITSYLNNHGFLPRRIDHRILKGGKKSPNLEVNRENCKEFYCEIKSPLHLVNEATKMYHWTTSSSN